MPEGDAAPASGDTPTLPPGHPLAGTEPGGDEPTTPEPSMPAAESDTDWRAMAEKWMDEAAKHKALSKKHEAQAKANAAAAAENARTREAAMSDTEKAVAAARREGRLEALRESASQIVDATVKTAAANRLEPRTVDALLLNLDRRAFMDDEGTVDTDAIITWVESIAPPAKPKEEEPSDSRFPDLGQGARGATPALNSSKLQQDLEKAVGLR
jgi:hypothetical protein